VFEIVVTKINGPVIWMAAGKQIRHIQKYSVDQDRGTCLIQRRKSLLNPGGNGRGVLRVDTRKHQVEMEERPPPAYGDKAFLLRICEMGAQAESWRISIYDRRHHWRNRLW
jgi:hypothetical protein